MRNPLEDLLNEYELARTYSHDLVAVLDPDQIAWRPHANSSAIGWHLGHQAAVNHYLVRNLTAAEPSIDKRFDALFDSATPEPDRGDLPSLDDIFDYRETVAARTVSTMGRIIDGDVGAPEQLALVAEGLLRALIHHEYQHDAWILEVRETLTDAPAPVPGSERLAAVEGYWMLDLARGGGAGGVLGC